MSTNRIPFTKPESFAQPTACSHMNPHTHTVQFYEDDLSFLAKSGEFIATALNDGMAAIVVVTQKHREGLEARLLGLGLDLAVFVAQGRYIALDASETLARFMVDGVPDPVRVLNLVEGMLAQIQAAGNGHRGFAVLGEMVALLWQEGNPEAAISLERLWNYLGEKYPLFIHCAYPMSGFCHEEDGNQFLGICAEHSTVIPGESYMGVASADERLRVISHLQQRARALESEIELRKKVQEQLRRRESELTDFLENAVEGVQQVGADGKIRWANRSMLQLLGYTANEYVGRELAAVHVHQHTFEEFWRKLMRQEDIYDFPAELRCKDGSVRHVLIHSNGLWENSHFVHTRCFVRDVTEHKRMEEALRESEKQAATGRLAADIAHEINNPLEALTSAFYLLQNLPSLDGTARSYAGIADKELQRVAHITRQMLALDQDSADPVPLALSEILDDVVELYEAKLTRRNLAVQRNYGAEEIVWGVPSEIRQLFANLFANAIEASGTNRTIRLRIASSPDWSDFNRRGMRVSIADHGSGISPTARQRLCEPFISTKGEGGTGLGLWVSKSIVHKHQGTMRFHSSLRPGRSGTVISVFLPAPCGNEAARNAGCLAEIQAPRRKQPASAANMEGPCLPRAG